MGAPPPHVTRLPVSLHCQEGGGSKFNSEFRGGLGPRRSCFPPALPIHKGHLCAGNTAHLGLGGRGCSEHRATVRAGQCVCVRPGRGAGGSTVGRSVNGPPSCPAHTSSSVLIPSPQNACFRSGPSTRPPWPWPQICPALTNIPLSLRVYGFSVGLLHVVGNQHCCPEQRRAWGGGGPG